MNKIYEIMMKAEKSADGQDVWEFLAENFRCERSTSTEIFLVLGNVSVSFSLRHEREICLEISAYHGSAMERVLALTEGKFCYEIEEHFLKFQKPFYEKAWSLKN